MNRQPQKQRRERFAIRMIERADFTQSLSARFEQQAARHPQRVALKSQSQTIAYDQLNRAANRLARAILAGAPSSREPIALLFNHGTALLTASLAVLKTGRPFVQIDANLPNQPTARVIADAGAAVIVTDREYYARAAELRGAGAVVLDLDALPHNGADDNLNLPIAPRSIAYINYTSGSTGAPKGVMSDHLSELHSIIVKSKALAITPQDRISLLRSHNVGATSDALLGLLNGAALCLCDLREEGLADLAAWLIREKITILTCVASVFRHALRDLGARRKFPLIRMVHLGGEPLFQSDIELFKAHFSKRCLLVNRLGISETKTASYFFIDKNSIVEEPMVPVGFALDGYEISVRDHRGRALKPNCVGEIAVKSRYLARGYWRRPALTEARFLADPGDREARVFQSGDMGYLRPDGCLVYVGRKDLQTKIRGHRVEPAEVEIALTQLADVKQAAVVARQQADGSARLWAYVVAQSGLALKVSQVRAALAEKLPGYMIPAGFVVLKRLPMTASGKIDRRALPDAPLGRTTLDVPFAPPSSKLEAVLARMWCEILQLNDIGCNDDFAALGGDSLLAARIVARVNQVFSLAQPLKTLFATPTVARLAAWITGQEKSPGKADAVARLVLQVDAMSSEQISQALGELP